MARVTVTARPDVVVANNVVQWIQTEPSTVFLGAAGSSPVFADQTTEYWLRNLRLSATGGSTHNLQTRRSSTETATVGPDLTPAWEQSARAIVLTLAGVEYVVAGPNSVESTTNDATEPYQWRTTPGGASLAAIDAFTVAWGSASEAERDAVTITLDDGVLPDAVAPTLAVSAPDVDEGGTSQIEVTPSGGTYDDISLAYELFGGAGGTVSPTGLITPEDVSADTVLGYIVTATVTGDGTTAVDGTSAEVVQSGSITVRNVLPDAVAPTVTIAPVADIDEGETTQVTASLSGGTYDAVDSSVLSVVSGGGSVTQAGLYTPADVTADTVVTIRADVTVSGDGTTAADGTTAMAQGTVTFTVRHVPSLVLADITVPDGETALVRALVVANISGVDLFDAPGDLVDGDLELASDLSIDMVERHTTQTPVRLRKTGTGFFSTYFGVAAMYPEAKLYLRVSPTEQVEFSHVNSGGSFSNWGYADSTQSGLFTGIASGNRFGVLVTTPTALPDASAPTPTIDAVAAGDEGTDVTLGATVPASDSTNPYDSVTYAWVVSGGTLDDAASATPVWTRPDVSADADYTIDLTITVAGDGTNAADSTSDTAAAAQVTATVRNVLSDAVAPTLTINPVADFPETATAQITANVAGGTYDTIDSQLSVVSGGGSVTDAGLYTPPDVSADTLVTVRATVTVEGDGTTALAGTMATVTEDVTFTVRHVPAVTTDTDSVWQLADTQPATPTGGTGTENHTPAGWVRIRPLPTLTQSVWQVQRTRSFSDGSFTSATAWGAATEVATRTPASVTASTIISTPVAAPDTYGLGEHIEIEVVFDTPVDVTGTPGYPINLGQSPGGAPEFADFNRGTGTDTLVFRWTVAATDEDTNGIFFYRNRADPREDNIDLPGGATIRNAGSSVDADLELDAPGVLSGTQGGHRVDGSLLLTAAAPAVDGDLTGEASAGASLSDAPDLAASAPAVDGNLAGTAAAGASLAGAPDALDATAPAVDGELTGVATSGAATGALPDLAGTAPAVDGGLTGTASTRVSLGDAPDLSAAAPPVDGGLTGRALGIGSLEGDPVALNGAAPPVDGNLAGTASASASLTGAPDALDAMATAVDGGLTGMALAGASLTGTPDALDAMVPAVDGGLAGTATARAALGGAPIAVEAMAPAVNGGLAGTASAGATVEGIPDALDAMTPTVTGGLTGTATTRVSLTGAPGLFTAVPAVTGGIAGLPSSAAALGPDPEGTHEFDAPAEPLPMTVDSERHAELLIGQWRGTRLERLIAEGLTELQGFSDALAELERMASLDTAGGVWLDYIGATVGLPRASVPDSDARYFGFGPQHTGFMDAPFASALDELQPLTPIGDACYRALLRARVVIMNTARSATDHEDAIRNAGIDGVVRDGMDHTGVVLLDISPGEIDLWRTVFERPVGVSLTVEPVAYLGGAGSVPAGGLTGGASAGATIT